MADWINFFAPNIFALRAGNLPSVHIYPNIEVLDIIDSPSGALMTARAMETETMISADYDCAILCTGFENESVFDSSIVDPELKSRVDTCSDRDRYAVKWDGPKDRMIFVQSQNRQTHGLGDGNFITAPSRNASILNAITGKEIYENFKRSIGGKLKCVAAQNRAIESSLKPGYGALTNAYRSALISSLWVVHMPCGAPL
jgi:lysine/ornithine N-monooxygenase